ncbi:hypothetical protein Afil01_42700 [Actinorhabdospora filicis]|uniref:Uncharacterized protein n=1 Tax=Actinorhabdospora filicis TaxID=1785913 RepID=A0A9W6WAW9_9ACTN|nr:hypothetical protein [Actinorhabdospora filicis]GLZ79463.1 hypothetical protein Afil01_42700 [Actinorhabdospora filicis]
MRDGQDREADEKPPTTWAGAVKKEKWSSLKEAVGSFGSAVTGAVMGSMTGSPTMAAIGGALGFALGGGSKIVGSIAASRGQARDDAKKAEPVESASAGSLGALKGILIGAAAAAEDCSGRIRGMKDKVEALLAELQGVLEGSSNSQVNTAIGELGTAASGLEKASGVAGTIGDKTKTWAAAL